MRPRTPRSRVTAGKLYQDPPPRSKAVSTEQMPTFCSHLPPMGTSLYGWNILKLDANSSNYHINQFGRIWIFVGNLRKVGVLLWFLLQIYQEGIPLKPRWKPNHLIFIKVMIWGLFWLVIKFRWFLHQPKNLILTSYVQDY